MLRPTLKSLALAAALGALALPAAAQQRYQSWTAPADTGRGQPEGAVALAEELQTLVDAARRQRAADPRFLDDLEDLARTYTFPWREIVSDTFSDGNFTQNPRWTVGSGQFAVDRRLGLRSRVALPQQFQSTGSTGGDIAAILLEQVIRQQAGQQGGPAPGQPAEIFLARQVANPFAVEFVFTSLSQSGGFELVLYADPSRRTGYRLGFGQGQTAELELRRVSGRGDAVIDAVDRGIPFAPNQQHTLLWTRDRNGEMRVAYDGEVILQASDRAFTGAFAGFAFVNRAGEYGVQEVTLYEAR